MNETKKPERRIVFREVPLRYAPHCCPHCEYDRQFPGFEGGGWMQQDNNGPIVSCPMCNDNGSIAPRP